MAQRLHSVLLWLPLSAVASCATTPIQDDEGGCRPPVAEGVRAPSIDALTGRYALTFVGTLGESEGKRIEGDLVIMPRPEELRPVLGLDLSPLAGISEPVYGAITADLEAVGAYVMGSLASMDPAEPGVVVRVDESREEVHLSLRLGSETNRRDRFVLDGAFVDAPILELRQSGLWGGWEASVGPTTYRAGGFFCAVRTRPL